MVPLEEHKMADSLRKLVCCILLLALAGTVSAGYGMTVQADTGTPAAGSYHGDRGLLKISGDLEKHNYSLSRCYFPLWRLPEYYVCIMVCKLQGYGDACPPYCEAVYTVCE
jgi:hypothetical protein